MSLLSWQKVDSTVILTLNNGENRHNPTFLAEILAALDEIEADKSVHALVIASSDSKSWSQGIDIGWIMPAFTENRHQDIKDFLFGINKLFKRVLQYPLPVIAAINGHTFGNGAILACACDFRFMKASRGFFCFPEVDINIPFLPGMLAIMKKAFPLHKLEEAMLTGKRMGALELVEAKVVFKACENDDELLTEALTFAKTFAKGRPIFGEIKKRHNKAVVAAIDHEDPPYIESLAIFMQ
jgi:enoyl-CoA hydratase/carnithine racemase